MFLDFLLSETLQTPMFLDIFGCFWTFLDFLDVFGLLCNCFAVSDFFI